MVDMMSKNSIIAKIEQAQLKTDVPEFSPGDTVVVQVRIKEGDRERLQAFEGVVIGKRNRGLNSAFTVRKMSHGVGVERTFQTHSHLVESITVKRRGDVRQAKLYYLRDLTGRAARITEKLAKKGDAAAAPLVEEASIAEQVEAAVAEAPVVEEQAVEEQAVEEQAVEEQAVEEQAAEQVEETTAEAPAAEEVSEEASEEKKED